jgi:hypothetical protein
VSSLLKSALAFTAVLVIGVPLANLAQSPGSSTVARAKDTLGDEMTTSERLARYPWWPTKFASAASKYAGSAACAECHAGISQSQAQSEMAQTLMPATQSKIAEYNGKRVTVDGFVYQFLKTPEGMAFTLPESKDPTPHPLTWAFGSGAISQVYFTPETLTANESHFSYFDGTHGFDVTPAQPTLIGAPAGPATQSADSTHKEVGRIVPMPETRRCFACHAANVPAAGPIKDVIAGVTCEACHGPGGDHVAAMRAGLPGGSLVMNPAHLGPVDEVDYCGSCHATSIDVQLSGGMGLPTVRFPAYRLENSACWSNDARIQCTACHDPHQPLSHDTAFYDQRCLACHQLALHQPALHQKDVSAKPDSAHPGRACPIASKDCASCHMPKYEFPDVHHKFTDHQIRVVKPGEHVPA